MPAFLPPLPPPSAFRPGVDLVHVAGGVYGPEEEENLVEVARSGHFTAGRWHAQLEHDLAKWFGVRYARLTNSGSSANLLAVAALTSPLLGSFRLHPGDEVITVAAGFPTTVAPIVQNRLVPVFVDVAAPTWNAHISQLEAALSPRTRAVMLAHTLGNPFNVTAVSAFCESHGLYLIEDNCDAAGSTFNGVKTGGFGNIATLSFYPAHHMTTGEGGAVLTDNSSLAKIVTALRDWGRDCWCAPGKDNTCGKRFAQQHGALPYGYDHKYVYSHLGYNLKMTDMQAAIGCAQLAKLDRFCEARRRHWRDLRAGLADLSDVLVLPEPQKNSDPSWFGFLVVVRDGAPFTRNDLVRRLEARKIQTRALFAGNLLRQPAMAGEQRRVVYGRLPATDYVAESALWVGVYPGVTPPMLDWVIESFHAACRGPE